VLASNNDFDGGSDPLLVCLCRRGHYTIRVSDLMMGGSKEHSYRLSVGAFPFVIGCFREPCYQ